MRLRCPAVFILLVLCSATAFAETIVPAGNVLGTWQASGSPYRVQGNIRVAHGAALTVNPGVRVVFEGAYALTVYGRISALGTATDSVYFTAPDTVTQGLWYGIDLIAAQDTCRFRYSVIERARTVTGAPQYPYGAGFYVGSSHLVLEHCAVRHNYHIPGTDGFYSYGTGLFVNSGSLRLSNCVIAGNHGAGLGVGLYASSSAVAIERTEFLTNPNTEIGQGGGIYTFVATGTITDCVFRGHNGARAGTAISFLYSTFAVTRTTFADNPGGAALQILGGASTIADCAFSGQGLDVAHSISSLTACRFDNATVAVQEDSSRFTDCTVENLANSTASGAVYCFLGAPEFDRCVIRNNHFVTGGYYTGAGVTIFQGDARFTNCLIAGNSKTEGRGAGLMVSVGHPRFIHCTIADNHAPEGGAALLQGQPELQNCILSHSTGGGVVLYSAEAQLRHCDFYGNASGDFIRTDLGPAGLGRLAAVNANADSCDIYGNIFADPRYVDRADGDYHLRDDSDCLGAGLSSGAPATDFNGHARPFPAGSRPDLGAYEHAEDGPLAVAMLGFEALPADNGITLVWRTASERDNRHFELFRRLSGDWSLLATVSSQGNTATGVEYRYTDGDVTPGFIYSYRLVAVDLYGARTEAGEVAAVSAGASAPVADFALLRNYPNPFNGSTVFTWLAPRAAQVRLVLFNALGEQMATVYSGDCTAGINSVRFDAARLPTGVYFSRLEADGRFIAAHKLLLLK